ncbi:nitrate regulatory gene2 protein isoform X2 [Capsella rubella]|uniref:nitrate regulatory gene2 protein isoform X2 n=1 Tax=Capsella rubella TaxID=81985 RepID=UPI000CD51A24|nr:nitrate regulatory gene2 protein isoform X2 [Capsella rubella]
MGCSPSKLDGLPAVALCRDRCNSLEETLRRSYALADAHSAYLLSLNTVGPALHRFFDQAVESPPDPDSEPEESSSSSHSVTSSDSDLPPKFDSDCEEEGTTNCDLFGCPKLESLNPNHDSFYSRRSYESGTITPPPPPPAASNYAWDFINLFESYELPYTTDPKDLKDRETTRCHEEYTLTKKTIKAEEPKQNLKISVKKKPNESEKKSSGVKKSPKDQKVSSDFSQVTKQLEEMFKEASDSGNDVSKMFDTSRFRYYQKTSVYQSASSNILYAKKMMTPLDPKPVEDFGTNFSNLSSTLKKLFMWEKKLYQEVKAEEKLRTAHIKNYKQLRRLEAKCAEPSKIEAVRSSIQCLSTRMRVSIHKINNICLMINKLRDEELWSQMKKLIHRLFGMWSSMLECHSRQSRVISEAKKLDKMTLKEKLDISQLELAMELKLELRNWSQNLSNWIDAQAQYVKALNSWLMRCLKQEPQEPTPDLSEEPPLFGAINSWSQTLDISDGEMKFTEAVYMILMHVNRQVGKQRMELEEQRNVNVRVKDIERKLVMLEKEELKMHRKMKTLPPVELMGALNLKSDMEQIFKSMEKLAINSKQTYEELDLMCT